MIGNTTSNRPRRHGKRGATIKRGALVRMHRHVREACRLNEWGPGTEGYSLLCSLGASLGCWPRLRRQKAAELRRRYTTLMRKLERGEV